MILKKPYAFLIRHFKLIHLVLLVLLCTIASYSVSIINFFNDYIANGYKATSTYNLVQTYTPSLFLIAIIFAIIIPLVLYILLLYKQKPNMIYVFMMVYYIVLLALFSYVSGVFEVLSYELISSTQSRVIRDISILYSIIQIPFIIVTFIRTVGFNLKKFSFETDFKDMDYNYKDAEEVEVGLNINGHLYKRLFRRRIREFKYYILENKFTVITVTFVLSIILGYLIFNNSTPNFDNYYNLNDPFFIDTFEVSINDAMLTSFDYKGDIIKEGKYYVVLKVKVLNFAQNSNSFDINLLKLVTDDGIISPKAGYSNYFSDFVSSDNNSYILANETKYYSIGYELDSNDIKNSYKVIVSDGIETFKNNIYDKSIYININPTVNNLQKNSYYNLRDVISFDEELLKGNTIQIEKYNVAKRIKYSYEKCSNNKCSTLVDMVNVSALKNRQDNYLLSINGEYNNANNSRYQSLLKVISTFGKIECINNGESSIIDLINVTPEMYTSGIIFEGSDKLYSATNINLIIGTRYNKYIIKLK